MTLIAWAVMAMTAGPALAITGAPEIGVQQAPWQAAVRSPTDGCGAVIIDANRVLTAAHCATAAPGTLQVSAGTSSFPTLTTGAQTVPVANARIHPYHQIDERGQEVGDDIAVLELARPLTLGSPTVQPIALVPQGPKLPAGTPLTISGYGHIQSLPAARGQGPLRAGPSVAAGPE